MSLDAWVCCNCVKEGTALPHPFPELLAFDKTGEPILKSEGQIPLGIWLKHDEWYRNSCVHSGHVAKRHLGNISFAAYVREFLEANSPKDFPLLLKRVVYSGSHAGDWIAASDAPQLASETRKLKALTIDTVIGQFTDDLMELANASIATGNPIVF